MQHTRAIDLNSGTAMVVTDLHGVGSAFDQTVETFTTLRNAGKADHLIICGDLIHGYGDAKDDHSLRMLSEIHQMQTELGRETVILLMGNHEMPHVYGVSLMKGKLEFTPRFEAALSMSGKRDKLMAFLRSLPFCVRTKAGVLMTHMGATRAVQSADDAKRLLTFDHDALLHLANDKLEDYDLDSLKQHRDYLAKARYFLAIRDENDPRLPELLRGQLISQGEDEFHFLWDVLFDQNEAGWGQGIYKNTILPNFLQVISAIGDNEQRVVVSGHIGVSGGHKLVSQQQLRLASYAHANPNAAGEYLLLNCAQPVTDANELVPHLHTLMA